MKAFFITATGTGVGKTFVTAALAHGAAAAGAGVEILKPVLTGYDETKPEDCDPARILAALGRPVNAEAVAAIAPFRFKAALAVDMAARAEGRHIDFGEVLEVCRQRLEQRPDFLLIEGAGGVMSPVAEHHTQLDLIVALGLPAILVVGSYLGTFSHSLTALAALRAEGVRVAAMLVNETAGSSVGLDETAASLREFAPDVPQMTIPRVTDPTAPHPALGAMRRMLLRL